jgi:hypothetical protein
MIGRLGIGRSGSPGQAARCVAPAIAAAVLLALPYAPLVAQGCNPVIDGTYCAEQMPRNPVSRPSRVTMTPIQEIGQSISPNPDSIGTFGGISFRGGTTCIGLLRRGSCD